MTAKIETEFIFETNTYFTSAQKTLTFLAISKLLDTILWRNQMTSIPLQESASP